MHARHWVRVACNSPLNTLVFGLCVLSAWFEGCKHPVLTIIEVVRQGAEKKGDKELAELAKQALTEETSRK
jgi:hypothetical protein